MGGAEVEKETASPPTSTGSTRLPRRGGFLYGLVGWLGFAAFGIALWALERVQFDVVHYKSVVMEQAGYWPVALYALMLLIALPAAAGWVSRGAVAKGRFLYIGELILPLILSIPMAAYVFSQGPPPYAFSFLLILAAGWAAYRIGGHIDLGKARPWGNAGALVSLLVLFVLIVVVHTRLQINFFEHFALGHSDIGHHTEELKNALGGRGLRCDSFYGLRFGMHFSPLLYSLVPGYALWPSPVYLMVCSVLLVHLPAFPAYYLARRLSGSTIVGWMFAVAWLLLPSQSRLVYANSYGFQWPYATMPLIALMVTAGTLRRWRACVILTVLIALCRETATAATFGWGIYMLAFTPRRKTGLIIALGSLLYLFICIKVIIPHFAFEGRYGRMDLFGELGGSLGDLLASPFTRPGLFFARLLRPEAGYLLLMLVVPMALLPLRGWRMALASLPALVLVLLIQEPDQLNIKFWHQASLLPLLFFAGLATLRRSAGSPGNVSRSWEDPATKRGNGFLTGCVGPRRENGGQLPQERAEDACTGTVGLAPGAQIRNRCNGKISDNTSAHDTTERIDTQTAPYPRRSVALACSVLASAAMAHYFFAFSPVAKPYTPYVHSAFLQTPDPRLETVRHLRAVIPMSKTIMASERLAAHFTDYARLYTVGRDHPADYVIIDRSDRWRAGDLAERVEGYADHPDYEPYGEFGPIIVFTRKSSAPPVRLDD